MAKYTGNNGESFEVIDITKKNCFILKETKSSELSLLWFDSNDNHLTIDAVDYHFKKNDIVCLTEFHKIKVNKVNSFKLLRFSKLFYCILDHDSEVGCKGILFFGASQLPIIHPTEKEVDILETVWKMLYIEMDSKDDLQLEMLQMMLKRILILCTRIYKSQINYQALENDNVDIVRQFNYLVELHFRQKHHVSNYADLLHKSPKTLSNLFHKVGKNTPLQFIHDRLMLEATRLLTHSQKSISEIGYELGFIDVQAFSRFFKTHKAISPGDFRNNNLK